MGKEALFKKQRELLREFLKKTRDQTLNSPTISKILTKIYSKQKLNKKELDVLKKPKK
ncbi:MAG: hypothetical protein Q8O03_03180 [Nanoarchaeota archaeon]|nr:hypothetical protein [Nanoarchaeota archaeon]